MERKLPRMTPIQLQMLVDILSVNPELISGKLTSNFTRVDRRNKWQALATLLNSKGLGPQKDADKWRKSWTDLKFSVRSKASKIELDGGVDLMCEKLTSLEKRVLQMIGDVSVNNFGEECDYSANLTDNFPSDLHFDRKLNNKHNETDEKNLVLPTNIGDSKEIEDRFHVKTEVAPNDDDDSYVRLTDDEGNISRSSYNDDHEILQKNADLNETLTPKRRKIGTYETNCSKSTILAFHRQIEIQTAVLQEQTEVMKDIAMSLHVIAKALQDR